jgi:acyl dehydratase
VSESISHEYPQRHWEDVMPGEQLPEISDHITFTRVASALVATLDFFPLHHDPGYADAQGHPDIILSTIQIMGFVDRIATGWAGPESFVVRRNLKMRAPTYPGDTLRGTAAVRRKWIDAERSVPRYLAEISIAVTKDKAVVAANAEVWLALPTASTRVLDSLRP